MQERCESYPGHSLHICPKWIIDRETGCFLKIVMPIGTDPLKTRIFPQLAVSVNTPEMSESFSH